MISVQNVSKEFGPIQAIKDVSFTIQPGEVVGFLGPNGAGKSTTMRLIAGFILPTCGQLKIGDIDIIASPVEAQRKTGYLPESVAIYPDMVVIDFLLFIGNMRGLKKNLLTQRLKAVATQCQLRDVLARKISELSKGFKQRVGLAQALLHDPDVLILDEPTAGLDPNQIVEIRELIKEIGKTKTILLSTHILPEVAATCQRVIIINKGQIVAQGTPQAIVAEAQSKITYKVSVRGARAQIEEKLRRLPDFLSLDLESSEDDLHHIHLHCGGDRGSGEQIFDLAVQNGWRLSHLAQEGQSLESVFKTLTK